MKEAGIAYIHGYDYVSGEWRAAYVDASGEIKIAVTIADVVRARISGDVVKISGEVVQISGQLIEATAKISGEVVKISGETVIAKISGETLIAKVSGEVAEISGQVVKVSGEVATIGIYQPVAPTVSSGQVATARVDINARLIGAISGETVSLPTSQVVKVSGEIVIAKISGETSIAKVSGETISLPSTQAVKISGEYVDIIVPTAVKTGAILTPTADSGGTIVTSGAVKSATFKSLSGDVYIGGAVAGDMPYSGFGFLLAAGEAWSVDIDNFGRARICAPVNSGDWVTYGGIA